MMRITHKKTAAVAVTAVLALGGGGIACAYFTAGGSGSGSANVGSAPADAFSITSTGPTTPVLPDNEPQSFTIQVKNIKEQAEYVGTVYMSIRADTESGDVITGPGAGTVVAGCEADWFTVTPSVSVDQPVATGDTVSSDSTPALTMPVADGTNQDPCQGVSIDLDFSTTAFH